MSTQNLPLSTLEQRIVEGLLKIEDPQSFQMWLGTLTEAEQNYVQSRLQFIQRIIEDKAAGSLYIPLDHLKTPTGWKAIIPSIPDKIEALQQACPEVDVETLAALMASLTKQDLRQHAPLHALYMQIRECPEWKNCYFALWEAAHDAILRRMSDHPALDQ